MVEKKTIVVGANLWECHKILKQAAAEIADPALKAKAEEALKYIEDTFRGQPQPVEGDGCRPPKVFFPSG